jgi:hypothetical protein
MSIDDMTIGQFKELSAIFSGGQAVKLPFNVGEAYLFRTVTHIQTGRVKEICGPFVVLEDAAWVADTGRFHDSLKNGDLGEVEPFTGDCILNTGSLIDATPWIHALPDAQK